MKLKISKIILTCSLGMMLFTSCDKYLDIVPKGSEVLTTAEQYSQLLDNNAAHIYNYTEIRYLIDDTWLNPAVITQAATLANTTYTFKDPEKFPRLNYYTTLTGIYPYSYDRINKTCNLIIDYVKDAEGDPNLKAQTLAEAQALRAYSYFFLVNLYAKHYDPLTAETDLCVPLWIHFDLEAVPEQGTVAQIYRLIESDLEAAIPHLSNTPKNNYHFSKAAGYALKAKVHLFKKEWAKAEEAATESYNLSHEVFNLTTYNAVNLVRGDQNSEYLYFSYGSSTSEYSWNAISPELYAMFDTINDLRYTGFMSLKTSTVGSSAATATEVQKGDRDYAPAFDSNLGMAKNYVYNLTGIRTTDVMLILAECRARANDFTGMKKYLDEVRKNRIKGYTTASENPSNWVDAVNIVIGERRKELLGYFNRFFDLRRLNAEPEFRRNIIRVAPANTKLINNPQTTYTLPPDSKLWIVPLPENEFPLYPGLQYNVPY